MKIYISGPMKGIDNYKYNFNMAEILLKNKNYEVFNPVSLDTEDNKNLSYNELLRLDIRALTFCDGIYMLKGWENSKGANIELNVAEAIGLKVLYEV